MIFHSPSSEFRIPQFEFLFVRIICSKPTIATYDTFFRNILRKTFNGNYVFETIMSIFNVCVLRQTECVFERRKRLMKLCDNGKSPRIIVEMIVLSSNQMIIKLWSHVETNKSSCEKECHNRFPWFLLLTTLDAF